MLEGSNIAEPITNGFNGFTIKNSATQLAEKIKSLIDNQGLIKQADKKAQLTLYLP